MNGDYQLLYALPNDWFNFGFFTLFSPTFLALGIYLLIKFSNEKNELKDLDGAKILAAAIFAIIFSVAVAPMTVNMLKQDYFSNNFIYQHRLYKTVEGTVSDYHKMPRGGHDTERFKIGDLEFEFGTNNYRHCYNDTYYFGGVMPGDGKRVRIGYISRGTKNLILKIEVLK